MNRSNVARAVLLSAATACGGCQEPDYLVEGSGPLAVIKKLKDTQTGKPEVVQGIELEQGDASETSVTVRIRFTALVEVPLPPLDECLIAADRPGDYVADLTFAYGKACTWPCDRHARPGDPGFKCFRPDVSAPPITVPIKVRP